ncbi:MAG: hypothetical protein KGL39_09725 [Patescibacteria group bacterium]|nr:hypothetical protein [Patescibacteria group bacterium]
MAQNRALNIQPQAVPTAAGNILNCAVTSLAGPAGITLTQPFMLLKHIRLTNKTAAAITATLYKGATGGSAAGTEFAFGATSVPANSFVDWYSQGDRFDSTDFLTGIASAAGLTLTAEGEVGFS